MNKSDSALVEPAPAYFPSSDWVLGSHPSVRRIATHIERAAEVECPVLICGETGTGKEVWANLVHACGPRREKPFLAVNCAALTPTLAESQLFGHEKGAFTGAVGASLGVFRAANSGIVFLDEVGEMSLELQPKLLRVLQEREVTPVGSARPVPVDVQVIAATNRDLEHEVAEGHFREDLYFRLNMVQLEVPPLRARVQDIPEFIRYFSDRFSKRYERPVWEPTEDDIQQFCEYHWPGNIRQLSHTIEQAYVLGIAPRIPVKKEEVTNDPTLPYFNLARLRTTALQQALAATRGHKGRAAKLLGVHANTLTRMLAEMEEEAR